MQYGYRDEEKEQARQELQSLQADFRNAEQDLHRERALACQGCLDDRSNSMRRMRSFNKLGGPSECFAAAKLKMMESGYRREEIAEAKAEVARLKANYDLLLAGTRKEEIEEAGRALPIWPPRLMRST